MGMSGAMGAGARVQADGGGRGEVEGLRAAVDRDPDDGVAGVPDALGQAPGFVAEDPGGGGLQGPESASSSRSAPPPSAARTRTPAREARRRPEDGYLQADRQVEERAGGRAYGLGL